MSYLNLALFALAGLQLCAFIAQALRTLHFARLGAKYLTMYREAESNLANMAEQYLEATKLIDIKRAGRMNVFTFARGEKFFVIETMGVMNDLPDLWREQAGLKPFTFQDNTKPPRQPITDGEEITMNDQKFVGIVQHGDAYWTLNGSRI